MPDASDLSVRTATMAPAGARGWPRALLARGWRLEAIAAVFLVALSTAVAHRYVSEHFALSYDSAYRDCTEDLLYPCVGRPGWTIDPAALESSPHWQAFVQRRIDSLSCDALRDLPRVSAGHLSDVQRYLHASMSAVFRATGPQRSTYAGFMTAMVGLTVLAAYGALRLAVGPLIALLAALPFVFSDLHLHSALHPAEYVKAPFIVGCLFVLGAIVRRPSAPRRAIALAIAAGAIAGVGIGFKTDVLICVPIGVAVIAAFAPRPLGPARRIAAAFAFLCAVLVAGGPVLKAQFLSGYGSLLPVQVLGGMDWNFAEYYAQPPLYDYGIRFDDAHVTNLINSYDQRVHGSTKYVEFYSKEMQRAATRLVVDIDRTFPADFLLRSFAGIVNVLKLGRFGLPAAVIVLSAVLVTDVRLAGCLVFLLCTAVGYVSLAFQARHFFHLEWVPWWFTALAVEQAIVRGTGTRQRFEQWLRVHAFRIGEVAAVVAAVVIAFLLVRQVQQSRLREHIAGLMGHASDDPLATTTAIADDGARRVTVEGLGAAPHPTSLVADYLALDVECAGAQDATITGVYEQATSPREPMTVPCSTGSRHWTLFWPVYQRPPAARFRWFEESSAAPVRILAIHRVSDARHVRLLLKLAAPDDYARRQWYQVLHRRFFIDPIVVRQSA